MERLIMENKIIKVLLIEDSIDDADLILFELEKSGFIIDYARVEDSESLKEIIKKDWDIIISDYAMHGFNGIEALEIVRSVDTNIPFLLASGTIGEDVAVKAMLAGAQDYIMKDKLARLGPAVERELKEAQVRIEKERAIKSLAENEARMKSIFVSAPIGIGTMKDRVLQFVNERMTEIVGYTKEELIGISTELLYESAEEFERVGKLKYGQITKSGISSIKTKYKTKSGKIIDVLVSSSAIDPSDYSKGYTFSVQDITKEARQGKLQEVLLHISNAINYSEDITTLASTIQKELAKVIDTTNFYIALYNKYQNTFSLPYFLDENDHLTELPANNTLSKYVIDKNKPMLLKNDEIEKLVKEGIIKRIASPSKCWLGVPLKKDGEAIGVLGVQSYVDENRFTNDDVGILEIVSEQIATSIKLMLVQSNLKESENRFKVLANASDQAVLISDGGVCIEANDKASEMLEITYHELIGRHAVDFVADEAKDFLVHNMSTGFDHPYEAVVVRKNGTTFPGLFHGRMFEYKGKPVRLTTVRDLTIEKQKEKEIIEAKNRAEESEKLKSSFLANMSHEIRTPMNGIVGFSEMYLTPGLSDEKRTEFANIVIDCSKQLLSIVNDILDISRIETGIVDIKSEKVVVNDLIAELKAIFDPKNQNQEIDLVTDCPLGKQKSTIFTDKTRVTQVLTNLLSNAFKFTKSGSIKFGYYLEQMNLVFYVEDSGIGIPKEQQSIIFERFRQVELELNKNYGGTGLGLAISKKLVEMLGGEIWVESQSGEGSKFMFTLPYEAVAISETVKENKVVEKEKARVLSDTTILVAEDEEMNFFFLKEVLTGDGITIIRAEDGLEAIEIFKANPGIDIVLMDIKMPKMNGLDATRKIKEINPDIPIIAQTAFAMRDERENAMAAGCDDYIIKPIKKEALIDSINRLRKN